MDLAWRSGLPHRSLVDRERRGVPEVAKAIKEAGIWPDRAAGCVLDYEIYNGGKLV